jgi:hypothetical protein
MMGTAVYVYVDKDSSNFGMSQMSEQNFIILYKTKLLHKFKDWSFNPLNMHSTKTGMTVFDKYTQSQYLSTVTYTRYLPIPVQLYLFIEHIK